MHLAIDIGNTQAKIGVFEPAKNKPTQLAIGDEIELLKSLVAQNMLRPETRIIICSVSKTSRVQEILGFLASNTSLHHEPLVLTHQLPVPVENDYQSPETLGMDRLAAIIGAKIIFPNHDCLVIDAGTCITFDFLKDGRYKGGAISPGLQIKCKALNTFTANLPLVELEPTTPLIGTDTKTSILSGVLNGTIAEINHTISEYKGISDNLAVILCGGEAERLKPGLKNVDCVEQELVLSGLNEILKHNVQIEQNRN